MKRKGYKPIKKAYFFILVSAFVISIAFLSIILIYNNSYTTKITNKDLRFEYTIRDGIINMKIFPADYLKDVELDIIYNGDSENFYVESTTIHEFHQGVPLYCEVDLATIQQKTANEFPETIFLKIQNGFKKNESISVGWILSGLFFILFGAAIPIAILHKNEKRKPASAMEKTEREEEKEKPDTKLRQPKKERRKKQANPTETAWDEMEKNDPKDEWDYRNRYPKNYRCEDGDYVRSKAEREIDDFLYRNRIWHVYESEYICMENGWKYYPDFYLPDYNLYIEYFGREDKKYREKRDQKIKMYTADENVNFVWLDAKDDANITERLTEICKQYKIFGTEKKTKSFHP